MATSFVFNGQTIKIPGAYSDIKSGIRNPSIAIPTGNILVIDTGSGAGYGGGSGINGELYQGKDSIYNFDNIADFRDFSKGGLWWLLGQPLFRPAGLGFNGISRISFVKMATTTAPTFQYEFVDTDGDHSASASYSPLHGANLTIQVTDEGLAGNGTVLSGNLIKGFAGKMSAGKIDTDKFVLTFYRGTYKGLDQNNLPYDGISSADSVPLVVAKSPEVSNVQELIDWMTIDFNFNKYFKLQSSSIVGNGMISEDDLTTYQDYNIASGGTENYDAGLIDDVLTAVADLDVNFIFSDKYGSNARSSINSTILASIIEDSKFKPELYIGGGDNIDTFVSQTIAAADYFNNDSVSVVHGAIYKQSQQGRRTYNVMYKTAAILAREAGIESQVPITFKSIDIDGEVHSLNDKEATKALDAGVIASRLENGSFDIIKGVNTLQQNTFLVNDDGTTSSKQIKRIARQMNNEIRINSKLQLLKQPNGVNRNTLSAQDVEAWLIGYLKSKMATNEVDNLILGFQDITVVREQDGYKVTYKFIPNSEISFLFFSGLIIGI